MLDSNLTQVSVELALTWSRLIEGFLSFDGWLPEKEASSFRDDRIGLDSSHRGFDGNRGCL